MLFQWLSVLATAMLYVSVLASPIISGLSVAIEAAHLDESSPLPLRAIVDQRVDKLSSLWAQEAVFREDIETRNKGTQCILPDYSSNAACPGSWSVQLSQDRWLCCSSGADLSQQDFSDITVALENSVRGSVWPSKMVHLGETKRTTDYEKLGFHDHIY